MTLEMSYKEKYDQGLEDGIEQGIEQNKLDNATRMLEGSNLTLEEIATYSGLSIDQVRELKEKII